MKTRLLALALAALLSASAFAAAPSNEGASALAEAATQIQAAAGEHRLLLLGETHGTCETPQLVGELLKRYAEAGPVILGLELGRSLTPAFDAYMASDGATAARAALVADPYWHVPRERNDGRRNLDVVDLIEQARQLKHAGSDVAVLAFDISPVGSVDGQAREKAMALRIREAFASLPRGRLLALAGNVHAMQAKPSYAPPELQDPMGSYLGDLDPWSVVINARDGEHWACSDVCGPVKDSERFQSSGPLRDGAFDYGIVLPRFTMARLIDP